MEKEKLTEEVTLEMDSLVEEEETELKKFVRSPVMISGTCRTVVELMKCRKRN